MLVLSRKSGESIVIGDKITLRVVQIEGRRVKLGIEAPPEMRVVREELKKHWKPRLPGARDTHA